MSGNSRRREGADPIAQLKKLHSQKVRSLLRSNDTLKKDLQQARNENRDNYRVKMIRNLRIQLKETEAMNTALKGHAMEFGSTIAKIDDLYEAVLNTPKRARPVRVETLQREIAALKAENKRIKAGRKGGKSGKANGVSTSRKHSVSNNNSSGGEMKSRTQHAVDEIALLESKLTASESVLNITKQMLQQVQSTNRSLRGYKSNAIRSEEQVVTLENEIIGLKDQLLASVSEDENYYQEIRMLRAKVAQLSKDKQKNAHTLHANTSRKDRQLDQQRGREQHLQSQIALLKADVKTAQEIAEWHKQQAQLAQSTAPQQVQLLQAKLQKVQAALASHEAPPAKGAQVESDSDGKQRQQQQPRQGLREENIVLNARLESFEKRTIELQETVEIQAKVIADLAQGEGMDKSHTGGPPQSSPSRLQTTTLGGSPRKNMVVSSTSASASASSAEQMKMKAQYSSKLQQLHARVSDLETKLTRATMTADRDHSNVITLKQTNHNLLQTVEQLRRKITGLEHDTLRLADEGKYNERWCTKLKECVQILTEHVDQLEQTLKDKDLPVPARPEFVVSS